MRKLASKQITAMLRIKNIRIFEWKIKQEKLTFQALKAQW